MDLLFFGSSDHPILGAYHPADFSRDRSEGMVLCYPFGQEYMRAHRAYRQLASSLSKLGYHVLRFDYRGTGDSYGDLEDMTPSQWMEDIQLAIRELTDISGVRKISLIGLRLGALLAHNCASTSESKIHRLVLWDPISSGQTYLEEINSEIKNTAENASNSNFVDTEGTIHFNGFAISKKFQTELLESGPISSCSQARQTMLAVSHESSDFKDLQQILSGHSNFNYIHQAAPHDWNYVDHAGGILLPTPLINRIVDWFK